MMSKSIKNQQGAALVVGLILLTIITLMGYTTMKGTMLQEKMAAGLHNRTLAHAGANSAIRAGEAYLNTIVTEANAVKVTGRPGGEMFSIYSQTQDPNSLTAQPNVIVEQFKERNWDSTAGTTHFNDFTLALSNGSLNANPQYIIEEIIGATSSGASVEEGKPSPGDSSAIQKAFLVTGKSQSGDGRTIVLNQSMYTVVVDDSSTN